MYLVSIGYILYKYCNEFLIKKVFFLIISLIVLI